MSVENRAKITKDKFIESAVFSPLGRTNKNIATELNISESYYYKLLKKYSVDVNKALELKRNSLRLKAINVVNKALSENDVKTALEVLKQIGWSDNFFDPDQRESDINEHFRLITSMIRNADTNTQLTKIQRSALND